MSGTTTNKSGRSALRRGLVASELLDQATRLFAEKGFESTTLHDIAEALEISRTALYHYVHSKDELLEMLVEQMSAQLGEVLATLKQRSDLSPTEKLRDAVALIVRQRCEHPDQFRILDRAENVLAEPTRTLHLEAKRKVLRELRSLIEEGIESGDLRRVDSRTAALSLLGMCNWVAWWFPRGADPSSAVTTVTDLAMSAVRVAPSQADAEMTATLDEMRRLLDGLDPRV